MAVGTSVLRLLLGRVKRLLRVSRLRLRHKRNVLGSERGATELVIRAGATEKSLLSVSEPPDRGGLVTSGQVSSDRSPGVNSAGQVDLDSKRPTAALPGPARPAGPGLSGPGPRTLRVPPSWSARPATSPAGAPSSPAGDVTAHRLRPSDVITNQHQRQRIAETESDSIDTTNTPISAMDQTDRVVQLERRNADLQRELADVQDKLSASRAERDDIGIKYSALTDRLDRMMKPGEETLNYDPGTSRSATSARPDPGRATAIDTIGRGRRLEEENQAFRRRLESYQDSQRQQAQLVARLQEKVDQYRQRCAQLEDKMADSGRRLAAAAGPLERPQTSGDRDRGLDLETALVRLEEAENRCVTLSDVNALLREQLDAAQESNEALTSEIQKLTADWQRLRDEMEHKELDWKEEEQTFNEYYNAEHARMLKLWKEIVGFRRDFSDLKLGTERDLSRVKSEMARLARQTADACSTAAVSPGGAEQTAPAGSASVPAVRKQVSQMSAAFGNASMWEKMQDIQKQETTFRVKKREMETKIKELSNQLDMARSEIVEKEKVVVSLNKMVHTLESSTAELSQKLETSRLVTEENEVLSQAIREVAQLVVDDSERGPETDDKVPVLVKTATLASTDPKRTQHDSGPSDPDAGQTPRPAPRRGLGHTGAESPSSTPSPPSVAPRGGLGYMTGLAWWSPQDSSVCSLATPSSPASPSIPVLPTGSVPESNPHRPYRTSAVEVPSTAKYMLGLALSRSVSKSSAAGYLTGPGKTGTMLYQPSTAAAPVSSAAPALAAAPATTAGYMAGLAWTAPAPGTPPCEAVTPASGETSPPPAQGIPQPGGTPSTSRRMILDAPVGSSTVTPFYEGVVTPNWSTATPGSGTNTPVSGTVTPTQTAEANYSRMPLTLPGTATPPWEVATPGSGAATPVPSLLPGSMLPVLSPVGLPSLQQPSWPQPGSEMESGVGAGPGSEPQPLSRPVTARRSRPKPEPEPEPPDNRVPSVDSVTPEASLSPSPAAEEPSSPVPEAFMEVVKAKPTAGKGGCCSVS